MRTQLLVELVPQRSTVCLSFEHANVTLDDVKTRLQVDQELPTDAFRFLHGTQLLDGLVPHAPSVIRAVLAHGLLGGKGGFGAMLRSQGKGAGQKPTTDFGACRDLSGRRLRHVNQEIAIQKWNDEEQIREQRKRDGVDERELPPEETPSGIAGWHLNTPAWAEGFGKKKGSKTKRKRNTIMCNNWLQARARSTPPEDAPRWWGCPRGRNCNFAHGEIELRGEELTLYKQQKKDEAQRQKDEALATYLHPVAPTVLETDVNDAFAAGLRKRRALQQAHAEQKQALETQMVYAPGETRWATAASTAGAWLVPLNGNVVVAQGTPETDASVLGQGTFGTATVFGCALHSGQWYYEVELGTAGIMQLGWADAMFEADDDEGDGVGDHVASWAYDGHRRLKWTNGDSTAYGDSWAPGDVIGCLLDLDARTVSFSRNGTSLGVAFDDIPAATPASDSTLGGFYPAVSLEANERLLLNIGDRPFLHCPEKYNPVLQALVKAKAPSTPFVQPAVLTPVHVEDPSTHQSAALAEAALVQATPVLEVCDEATSLPEAKIDLTACTSVEDLIALGADTLKVELMARGMKWGGLALERAKRLWSVRGLETIPSKLLARKPKQ
ncbi:hypothetical protein SDRG_13315 [Saprolegnia diclina VS20]|uniref:C3H1-type domain-containing protein n=1 Tax=Saprolegnia diclina (strain VS20) TaxID=1156394 RepID=T0RA36_SAPDV|nr:hypothetical protein SDRG_13315 [Saprolegnia diclina VS20]EQC28978.1 hypothetical protein SDRG_13315 [Saprolegnia diclina VS20]|eukprot:XP_008617617.1 hypothetical protein SDRG_13315 [Saprolegnia diclina VS20]